MAAGFFVFSFVDTLAKLLTDSFPPLQVVWIRQWGLLSGILILLAMRGPRLLRSANPRLQITRGALAAGSAAFFVLALKHVPLADAIAVTFVAPFIATMLGAVLLGERVGLRRWLAVAVGFAGMLVVVRPGLGVVHPAMALVVLAAACFALRQVASRALLSADSTGTTLAYTAITSVAILGVPVIFLWHPPETWTEVGLLASMAVLAALGESLVVRALDLAEVVVLAPVHYSMILWGTFWGWLVFAELPDGWTLTGAAIIVATGLYTLHRERLAKVRAP